MKLGWKSWLLVISAVAILLALGRIDLLVFIVPASLLIGWVASPSGATHGGKI